MGMLDWVHVAPELLPETGFTFTPYLLAQTKAFDREMAIYLLSAATEDEPALLWRETIDAEHHPTLGISIRGFGWVPKREVIGRHAEVLRDYTGTFEFHHYAHVASERTTLWLSYEATVVAGVVKEVVLCEMTTHEDVRDAAIPGSIAMFPLNDPGIAWRISETTTD